MPQMMGPFVLFIVTLILSGCSGGSESGRVFSQKGHPDNWASPLAIGSDNFHGTVIKSIESGSSGAVLFSRHCAACHGDSGLGKIGPNIQGDTASRISAAIQVVPLMKGHSVLSSGEIEDISGYLVGLLLPVLPPSVSIVITPDLCMECHGGDLKGGIAKVSCFSCHNGPDGSIGHPAGWAESKEDAVNFHGRYGETFVSACANCHGADLGGGIGPPCSNCHNGSIAPPLEPFLL